MVHGTKEEMSTLCHLYYIISSGSSLEEEIFQSGKIMHSVLLLLFILSGNIRWH